MAFTKLQDLGHVWDSMTWIQFNLSLSNLGFSAHEIDYERTLLKSLEFTPMMDVDTMKARYYTALRIGYGIRELDIIDREAIIDVYLAAANVAAYGLRDL